MIQEDDKPSFTIKDFNELIEVLDNAYWPDPPVIHQVIDGKLYQISIPDFWEKFLKYKP